LKALGRAARFAAPLRLRFGLPPHDGPSQSGSHPVSPGTVAYLSDCFSVREKFNPTFLCDFCGGPLVR
jgi:hypothetical protein